jgi:hypothetical protein
MSDESTEAQSTVSMASIVGDMETASLVNGDVPTSVFMLIKARNTEVDVPVWSIRQGGEVLSSEELLGALSSIAESIKQDLASDWKW